MPLDARGILDGLRVGVIDWGYPGPHLHPPRSISPLATAGGARILLPSPAAIGLGAGLGPTTRLWPFFVREAGLNFAAVAVSQQFTGPALIASIVILTSSSGGSPHPSVQLYYAPDSGGGGNNLSVDAIPGGTRIWETISFATDDGTVPDSQAGMNMSSLGSSADRREYTIGRLVELDRFFLKLRLRVSSAGADVLEGWVRIVENYDPIACACPR